MAAPMRLSKYLSRVGQCSRRQAERLVENGRVTVNGVPPRTAGVAVSDTDNILVNEEPVPSRPQSRLWLYHKPPGVIVTHKDPQGRPTVFMRLRQQYPDMPRVVSVGRLDIMSQGLLLLTNDGELKRHLETAGWIREYRIRVNGHVTNQALAALQDGVTADGVRYAPLVATLDKQVNSNAWLTLKLTEGKRREIRQVCEKMGWGVARLLRTKYGPFLLGDLKSDECQPVTHDTLVRNVPGLEFPPGTKLDTREKDPEIKAKRLHKLSGFSIRWGKVPDSTKKRGKQQ